MRTLEKQFHPPLNMSRHSSIPFFAALMTSAVVQAGEVTIAPKPFTVEHSFTAGALPAAPVLLKIEPEAWGAFEITSIATHGSKVESGAVLVAFDSEGYAEKLEDTRREVAAGELALAQAELEFKTMKETAPHQLEAVRTAAKIAKEENEYFIKVRRKAAEEGAEQSLKRNKQYLASEQEELKQLEKMYAEDDLTEETEEIILVRQRDAVETAEFALRMEILDHERTLKVLIPRQAEDLANKDRDAAIALAKTEEELPRQIELKEAELVAARTAHARAKESLAELEADKGLFEFKAPADGWFYYGGIEEGRWTTGEAVKALVVHGLAPVNKGFATFIPADSAVELVAFVDETVARGLSVGAVGGAVVSGREEVSVPVKLTALDETPGTDGRYRATLSAEWPKESVLAPGSTVEVHLLAYEKADALAVPNKALTAGAKGWTIEVKLADGKTERRVVQRGRAGKEETEIVSGIEAGQVVVVP